MQKNNCLFSSASVEWATPQALFDKLDAEFHFDLDPCSTHENAKCAEHFTKAERAKTSCSLGFLIKRRDDRWNVERNAC